MDKVNLQDVEIRSILQKIKRRWYIVFIFVILALAFSYYKGYNKTTIVYQAKVGLIVGNPNGSDIAQVQVLERFIDTYCALARTSFIAEKVSAKLNKGISAEAIQSSISATPQPNTQFMNVSITWGTSDEAKEILNIFSEVFIAEARKIYPNSSIQVIENIKEPKPIIMSTKVYSIILPVAGAVLAILIIFGIDLLDNTIKTVEEVEEYLNGSVIGEIPKDKNIVKKINSVSIKDINQVIIEAFRTLRTNVEFVASCNNLKSIIVTSARPQEGKTSIAAILALVISQTRKRTILIDCDLRNPKIHKLFSISNEIGLTDYLCGNTLQSQVIKKTSIENLSVITSGRKISNSTELLESLQMKSFMKMLKNDYDFIVIDTPPVGLVTDAQILSQLADGSIFVVSSCKSVRKDTIKSKEFIRQVGGNIIGFVLNKINYSNEYKKYAYYYNDNNKFKKDKIQ